ncbi:MAG: glycosyltransferase family 2 protein, partial [Solirubrobacterales bacterium]|nr:glycosyltransferase family 2 protein [Solirubrobacterales bacterium]
MRATCELSVVIPVYGCEPCLRPLHRRVSDELQKITPHFEIIFVDDCSTDGGWDAVRDIASQDPHVRAFRLSRNFGQQAAIAAGMEKSRGRWTVVMDCDLQDPPEVIEMLYA